MTRLTPTEKAQTIHKLIDRVLLEAAFVTSDAEGLAAHDVASVLAGAMMGAIHILDTKAGYTHERAVRVAKCAVGSLIATLKVNGYDIGLDLPEGLPAEAIGISKGSEKDDF